MEHLNDKIKSLKKDLSVLLKMEQEIVSDAPPVKAGTPTEAIKKEIDRLSVMRRSAKDFNDKVEEINERIIDLRTSFENAEQQFLELLSGKNEFNKSDFDHVNKDLEKLKETRSKIYELKMFKPKNSIVDVELFSKRINELLTNVESGTSDLKLKLTHEREESLSKEHALKQKIQMLLEERDFEFTSFKQEIMKEMELLEARMKGDDKVLLVKLEEIRKILDSKAGEKSVDTRLTEIEKELENVYSIVSGVRKTSTEQLFPKEKRGKITRVIDFLAGEK